ncbi:MAG: hypothetical protein ACXAC7_00250 [Candidatus Hodarchaeales archaeon]|jgi:hypothetical protein
MTPVKDQFDILGMRAALKHTPSEVSSLLLKTMLNSFKESVCINQCQFNRVVCILRPKCPQRHFQDLLIQSGFKFNEIPQFCYSIRLKEIHESYNRDLPLPSDVNIFISDFHRIFGLKKPRFHPKREFQKVLAYFEIKNVNQMNKDFLVIGFKKNLIFVDLNREMVTLNPNNWILEDQNLVKAALDSLAIEYDISVQIQEEQDFFLDITFDFSHISNLLDTEKFEEVIRHSDTLMGYDAESAEIYGELQILKHTDTSNSLNILTLRRIFNDLAEFSNLVGLDNNLNQKEKVLDTIRSSKSLD